MTDVYEEIERLFPYDGPHSADSIGDAALFLSRLVRYLNNATQNPERLNGPLLYRVLTHLNAAESLQQQLLAQLVLGYESVSLDQTAYDDRRDRPASSTVAELASKLLDLRPLARQKAVELGVLSELASHVGHDYPPRL